MAKHRAYQDGDWVRVSLTGATMQGMYLGPSPVSPGLLRVRMNQGHVLSLLPTQVSLERAGGYRG